MSKGNPIVPIRIERPILMEMNAVIRKRNATTRDEPWTRTAFIVTAILEKIKKMERGRKPKKRKPKKRKQVPIADVGVLHRDPRDAEFWEGIVGDMQRDEREAIDGEN